MAQSKMRTADASISAIEKIQAEMAGEAERTGLDTDEKIVEFCKEVRRDVYRKHYARHD